MSERDLTVSNSDRSGGRLGATAPPRARQRRRGRTARGRRQAGWLGARASRPRSRALTQRFRRGGPSDDDGEESTALVRTGGALARWISFPRGVRFATAATSSAAAGLAAWGMLAVAANDLGIAAAAAGAAARCRRPGGRSPCGSRTGCTGWWRGAGWCASRICARFPIDARSPCAASSSRAERRRRRSTGAPRSGR